LYHLKKEPPGVKYLGLASDSRPPLGVQVLIAASLAVIAFALNALVSEAVSPTLVPLSFVAVIVAAWYGGTLSGILCIALSIPLAILLAEPRYEFAVAHREDALRILLFTLAAVLIVGVDYVRRRAGDSARRSQAALAENEQRLRIALQAGGMGTFLWRIGDQAMSWSPGVETAHGLPEGTLSGTPLTFLEVVHPADRQSTQLAVTRCLQSGAPDLDIEYRTLLPGGAVRWMAAKGRVARDARKQPVEISGVVWDFTDRKQAEETLAESEARFRALADGAPVLIWINGLDGCEFVNAAYIEFMGKTPEDVLGMKWAEAIHPEDAKDYLDAYAAAVQTRAPFEAEVRLRRHDGQYRWMRSVGLPRYSAAGELLGYGGSSLDVTDMKAAQDELAGELEETRRLHAVINELTQTEDVQVAMERAMEAAIHAMNVDKGLAQVYDEDAGVLRTVANRGLNQQFLDAHVGVRPGDPCVCGTAAATRRAAVCRDVLQDERTLLRESANHAGFRAVQSAPLLSADGRLLGVLSTHWTEPHEPDERQRRFLDIYAHEAAQVIERQQRLAALRRSEERFRTMAEASPSFMFTADATGSVTFWSPGFYSYAGVEAGSPEGEDWELADVTHPDDRRESARLWAASLVTGDPFRMEVRLRRADGAYRWFLNEIRPVPHARGGITEWVGACTDIHDQKLNEERERFLAEVGSALAESLTDEAGIARAVRLAVRNIAEMCVMDVIEGDGETHRVVAAHSDPRKDELIARSAAGEHRRTSHHPVSEAIRARRTILVPEITDEMARNSMVSPESKELATQLRPASMIVTPMVVRGRTIGAVTLGSSGERPYTSEDIPLAEEFARRLGLAIENSRLYAESQAVQEELRESNRTKDEFLGMVSHELRTPITTVYSGANLLLNRFSGLDEETRKDVLLDIEHEAERLRQIVENLLALGRVEIGQALEPEPVSVRHLVSGVVARVNKLRPHRKIALEAEEGSHYATGVPAYLEMTVRNILDNADKYSPQDAPIEVRIEDRNGSVNIRVRDYGPGIQAKDTGKLFDQYYRSESVPGHVTGTGVGLTVCKRLMESQGGSIVLRNADGAGLEVTLSLPRCEDE
jgi:PAS domain S-box-containing protein